MTGEFTIDRIEGDRWKCIFNGKPKNIEKMVFAKDKKIATKTFMEHLRAVARAESKDGC